jgi:hypothetical protein
MFEKGSAGVSPAVFGVLAEYVFPFRETRNGATWTVALSKTFSAELWNFLIPVSTNIPALTGLEILKGFQSFSPVLPTATLGNHPINPSTLKELDHSRHP